MGSHSSGSPIKVSNQQASKRAGLGQTAGGSILEDHQIYKLHDLVTADFEMSANDKDYKLGHDQVIKVCKILLHKINYNNKRNGQDKDLLMSEMLE